MKAEGKKSPPPSEMAEVVDRNIRALLARRQAEDKAKSWDTKLADAITRFTGSMKFVLLHIVIYGIWIGINLPWSPPAWRFDPTFVALAMVASVEAIFLSTFILISQNRMQALADKQSDLDLQVSLLAEHEITRLITLAKAIADRFGIQEGQNPELKELEKDVKPEKVLDRIEENEKRSGGDAAKT